MKPKAEKVQIVSMCHYCDFLISQHTKHIPQKAVNHCQSVVNILSANDF